MLRVNYLLALKGKEVWTIEPDAPVLEAIRVMAERGVGALPVVQGNELIGIVSERDYARKVILLGRSSSDTPVRDIMSSPAISISADQAVHNCMEIMTEKRFGESGHGRTAADHRAARAIHRQLNRHSQFPKTKRAAITRCP
jgi:CBS domain-containing protein